MRIATVYLLSLAFVFSIFSSLSYAQSELGVSFINKYREIYYANNINNTNQDRIVMVLGLKCKEDCNTEAKKTVESLAKSGDLAALSLMPFISSTPNAFSYFGTFNALMTENADKGEVAALTYAYAIHQKDKAKAFKYASAAKNKGNITGYNNLATWYLKEGNIKMFCDLKKEEFQRFGFESLNLILTRIDSFNSNTANIFFKNCTKKSRDELIKMAGLEGQLIEGYALLEKKQYADAIKIFEHLYSVKANHRISANAGYCLGVLNYYGKGVVANKSFGKQLLYEALKNGVYDPYEAVTENELPPSTGPVITYFLSSCSYIDKK